MTSRSCDQRAHWTASCSKVAFFQGWCGRGCKQTQRQTITTRKATTYCGTSNRCTQPCLQSIYLQVIRAGFQEEAKLEHMPGGSTHGWDGDKDRESMLPGFFKGKVVTGRLHTGMGSEPRGHQGISLWNHCIFHGSSIPSSHSSLSLREKLF